MGDAVGIIFGRAVNFVLQHAIPTHFDRSQEYKLGDVLVYEKKLRVFMPWRKHRLVFTGVNIADLLTEAIHIETGEEQVFTEGSISRTFGESAKVDGEVMYAIAHLGVQIDETEHATISADFGKIDRHYTNLSSLLSRQAADKKFRVLADHPVIKDAIAHNRTLFVINNLYVAEKADVNLNFTDSSQNTGTDNKQANPTTSSTTSSTTTNPTTTTTGAPSTTTTTGAPSTTTTTTGVPSTTVNTQTAATSFSVGGDINLSFQKLGKSVVNRDEPTNIAYRVIRFKLGSHGNLIPQLRADIRHVKVKVVDETDFGGPTNVIDAKKQTEDNCEYTHDRYEVMAAREHEP